MGPFPKAYKSNANSELQISGRTVNSIAQEVGTSPIFIYSREFLTQKIQELRMAMPDSLDIHYAMKANPYKPLLQHMKDITDGFGLASGGELELALDAGVSPSLMSFAGPGKKDTEIEKAVFAGVTLNAESPNEVDRIIAIADRIGKRAKVAIRVNPSFDLKGSGMKMGGGAKQFGMDEDLVAPAVDTIIKSNNDWRGFHIYAGSQSLRADAIIDAQAQTLVLAARLAEEVGVSPATVNLGGGFGIPYFPGEENLDVFAIGEALNEQFLRLPKILQTTKFCIELGRYLVGEAGIYVTKIIDHKISHGETFWVVDGGLHHQLAASGNFGTVIRRNYPIALCNNFDFDQKNQKNTVNIVGCLCTPLDLLGDKVAMPEANIGDLVAVFCAGAYGASASPVNFLGHGPATEILI